MSPLLQSAPADNGLAAGHAIANVFQATGDHWTLDLNTLISIVATVLTTLIGVPAMVLAVLKIRSLMSSENTNDLSNSCSDPEIANHISMQSPPNALISPAHDTQRSSANSEFDGAPGETVNGHRRSSGATFQTLQEVSSHQLSVPQPPRPRGLSATEIHGACQTNVQRSSHVSRNILRHSTWY